MKINYNTKPKVLSHEEQLLNLKSGDCIYCKDERSKGFFLINKVIGFKSIGLFWWESENLTTCAWNINKVIIISKEQYENKSL